MIFSDFLQCKRHHWAGCLKVEESQMNKKKKRMLQSYREENTFIVNNIAECYRACKARSKCKKTLLT